MPRKPKVKVHLNETRNINKPSEEDISNILRAADEIIDTAGRNMLVKILKGSKDKKLLEHGLDNCPSYGYYNSLKMADIEVIVDWMIWNKYLRIVYNGKLPMIAFTEKGWERYKPILVNELIEKMVNVTDENLEELSEWFVKVNREIINMILDKISENNRVDTFVFLDEWKKKAYKKDAKNIRATIEGLRKK
jgi:superfamily II DNA helicase RecQ